MGASLTFLTSALLAPRPPITGAWRRGCTQLAFHSNAGGRNAVYKAVLKGNVTNLAEESNQGSVSLVGQTFVSCEKEMWYCFTGVLVFR